MDSGHVLARNVRFSGDDMIMLLIDGETITVLPSCSVTVKAFTDQLHSLGEILAQ